MLTLAGADPHVPNQLAAARRLAEYVAARRNAVASLLAMGSAPVAAAGSGSTLHVRLPC